VSSIENLELHCARLHRLVLDFTFTSLTHDCDFALLKIKYHNLHHIVDTIRRFGPLPEFSAKGSEAMNKVIRAHIINSNQQATSCDTTQNFGVLKHIRFLIRGGCFEFKGQKGSVGSGVKSACRETGTGKLIRKLLNLPDESDPPLFTYAANSLTIASDEELSQTFFGQLLGSRIHDLDASVAEPYHVTLTVRARNGDLVHEDDHVLVAEEGKSIVTQVVEILAPVGRGVESSADVIVTVSRFQKVEEVEGSGFVRFE
ncbi:hypothetical protein JCM5296_000589, partial [Sporobolomyces johnsonii]